MYWLRHSTGIGRQTDRQNWQNNIAFYMHCMLTRDRNDVTLSGHRHRVSCAALLSSLHSIAYDARLAGGSHLISVRYKIVWIELYLHNLRQNRDVTFLFHSYDKRSFHCCSRISGWSAITSVSLLRDRRQNRLFVTVADRVSVQRPPRSTGRWAQDTRRGTWSVPSQRLSVQLNKSIFHDFSDINSPCAL